jgi:hypothetical protein
MAILMAAIAFSETLRDTPAKQNPSTTTEETVERLMPDARKMSPKSTESYLRRRWCTSRPRARWPQPQAVMR